MTVTRSAGRIPPTASSAAHTLGARTLLSPPQGELPWYALQVRTRSELAIVDQLALRGLTAFSPCARYWKRFADRRKQVSEPLFPGYVFCQLDFFEQRLPVLTTPGVTQIVGTGQLPEPVPTSEIVSLQKLAETGLDLQPHPYLQLGQRVRVEVGPFAGVEGHLVQFKGADRLVVSINLLQRSISAEVDPRLVVPLTQAPGRTQDAASAAVVVPVL